jgi:16S rRNA (cytosine1402-N4)-methyltransferase
MYHKPVMPVESVDLLNVVQGGTYVDATYGGGGHSGLILEKLGDGKLIAFDQDDDAKRNIIQDERLLFVNQNFRHLENFLTFYKSVPVDGVFADLGVSSHQIDTPGKGFSYMYPDEMLDMRMSGSDTTTAAEILNSYDESELSALFFKYGELPFSRKLSGAIVKKRQTEKISKISDLLTIVDRFTQPHKKYAVYSRVFQALRMEVNSETEALEALLKQAFNVLKSGGRLVVISYHSVEDRVVKNFMRSGSIDGVVEKDFYGNSNKVFRVLTPKPVVPSKEEIEANPRSRSAKLRAAIKI